MRFVARAGVVVALAAALLKAQTAILECVSVAEHGPRTRLLFRLPLGDKPRVAKATLLAHGREDAGAAIIKLNGRKAEVRLQEKGWISVAVPPGEALKPLTLEGVRVDGCSPPAFAPYVVVEGPRSK